jgi:hypothetical protein
VHDPCAYDYALIRVVPHVERGECINAGVLVCSTSRAFLQARIALDEARLLALAPDADIAAVSASLAAFARICAGGPQAGPIGQLPLRARFDWLTAPRSTIIQTSPVHSGRCSDLEGAMERLLDRMVRRPLPRAAIGERQR